MKSLAIFLLITLSSCIIVPADDSKVSKLVNQSYDAEYIVVTKIERFTLVESQILFLTVRCHHHSYVFQPFYEDDFYVGMRLIVVYYKNTHDVVRVVRP